MTSISFDDATLIALDRVAPAPLPAPVAGRFRARRQLRLVRDHAGPVVKWAGGKTKLLSQIVPRLPATYGTYFEPFCGGAAVFFHLRPARAIVSDTCAELIELYRELARDPGAVFRELTHLITGGRPLQEFYERRLAWNETRAVWSPTQRAAMFLYLNKSCYNGLWRVNRSGRFNVPVGKFGPGGQGDPGYPGLADLVAAGEALRRAEICCEDYAALFDRARPGDLVYIDPPYPAVSKTASFSTYVAGGFDEDAQRSLAQRVLALVAREVQVVVSQADLPIVREIYAGLVCHEVSAPRSVNARTDKRGKVPELLLTGGGRS